jgi:hypothetical protein
MCPLEEHQCEKQLERADLLLALQDSDLEQDGAGRNIVGAELTHGAFVLAGHTPRCAITGDVSRISLHCLRLHTLYVGVLLSTSLSFLLLPLVNCGH